MILPRDKSSVPKQSFLFKNKNRYALKVCEEWGKGVVGQLDRNNQRTQIFSQKYFLTVYIVRYIYGLAVTMLASINSFILELISGKSPLRNYKSFSYCFQSIEKYGNGGDRLKANFIGRLTKFTLNLNKLYKWNNFPLYIW